MGLRPSHDWGHGYASSIYDVNRDLVVGQIGDSAIFPDPEGDIALSPQGDWFVNGHKDKDQKKNFYNFYRRSDGKLIRSQGFDIGKWISGDLRQDPSPAWNRSGTKILVPGLVGDTNQLDNSLSSASGEFNAIGSIRCLSVSPNYYDFSITILSQILYSQQSTVVRPLEPIALSLNPRLSSLTKLWR